MFKRIAPLVGILLTLYFYYPLYSANGEKLDKKLPSLLNLVKHGCAVNGPISMFDRNSEVPRYYDVWRVTFWAEHKGQFDKKATKDWQLLYAYRKTRLKALMDCEKFMERCRKAILKAKMKERE